MFHEPRVRSVFLSALAVLLLLLTGVNAAGASSVSTSASSALPCAPISNFRAGDFTNPTKIDNRWLPLLPGMQYILDGTTNSGTGGQAHRVIFTVSDVTKVINGVQTRVIWDRDISDGQLAERELAFFAQDKYGNVWNLGEYPEEFEDGVFAGAPSTWIAGLAGAKAGVHMVAKPQPGTPSYLQGLAPKIDFLDCGQVVGKGQRVSVPFGSYDNVLVTNEWSPLDPDSGIQVKYYAPGVGNVQIGAVNDPEAETLVLTKIKRLSADALEKVRDRVCKLDARGYRFGDVYRHTARAVQANGQPCTTTEAGEAEAMANMLADAANK